MKLLGEIRARARYVIGPVLGFSTIFYVGYNFVQGDRGLITYMQVTKQVERARQNLAVVGDVRQSLENRVRLLLPKSLDRDMLDERARIMLGYSHPGEWVILTKD